MVMVFAEVARVEAELVGGWLRCSCGGQLRPWGHARERVVRAVGRVRPRRAKCRGCGRTHVLLWQSCLLRRRDGIAVIGVALTAKAGGVGHRRIAERLGVPADTVRGWLRRFARDAEAVRAHFLGWAFALDGELGPVLPAGGAFADGVGAMAIAARAFVLRFGRRDVWSVIAWLSGGVLLCHTSCRFPPIP
jgi:transposase-like protein